MDLVQQRTAENRRRLADFFDGLDEDQLETPSLCHAWTVREVVAHLAMPFEVSLPSLLWRTLRARGSIDRASEQIAADLARRPVPELTGLLRRHAEQRIPAPGVGPMGQLVDGCVHLRDCARPLGLPDDVPLDHWRMVLDWLPTTQASRGVVPPGRLSGLRLTTTDQAWEWGSGATLSGPSEALALAVSGRGVALGDLTGPGRDLLAARVTSG